LKNPLRSENYRTYSWMTVCAVFILILLGGIVRSTGSGMGCPDWPKCFGQYIPPTSEDQLPENYQQDFLTKRSQKAVLFATLLSRLGFEKKSNEILNDPTVFEPEAFNASKTWTEYLNRLWGALTGIFALMALISSLFWYKKDKSVTYLTVLGVFLIFFNAWLGSIVVSTNLTSWVVTIHYLLAYIAAMVLMISAYKTYVPITLRSNQQFTHWFSIVLGITLIQIISGTSLRENSDLLVKTNTLTVNGEINISGLGISFNWHRILAFLSVVLNLRVFQLLYKNKKNISNSLLYLQGLVILLVGIQILTGSLNLMYNFPLIAQVQHIFGAGILFGVQAYGFIYFYLKKPLISN